MEGKQRASVCVRALPQSVSACDFANDCFNFSIAETNDNHSLSLVIEAITGLFFLRYIGINNALRLNLCNHYQYPLCKCHNVEPPCTESCAPALGKVSSMYGTGSWGWYLRCFQ